MSNAKNNTSTPEVIFHTKEAPYVGVRLDGIEFSADAKTAVKRGSQPPVRDTVCIPDGVNFITWAAHPRITAIAIPPSVQKIGQEAFTVFKNHYTPDGYYPMDDDPMGNGHHLNLRTVIFSDGLKEIGAWAFMNMKAISGIKLPKGLEKISEEAFLGCDGITQLIIPASVKSLGRGVFDSCIGLKKVIFVDGIEVLPSNLFYNNSALTELTLPKTLTRIGDWCFSACSALSEIDVPESVEEIGTGAFRDCTSITDFTIKRDIKWGKNVFEGCEALVSYRFEKEVHSPELLPYSPYVKSIEAAKDHPDFVTVDGAVYTKDKKTLVRVPFGISGEFTVPRGVTAIGNRAFSDCKGITAVNLPSTHEAIGEKAFYGCSALKEMNLGGKVRKIGDCAFAKCESLTKLHVSASVTEIGEGILLECGDTEITVSPANPAYKIVDGIIVRK